MFFFKRTSKTVSDSEYELVEHPLDDGGAVPGVRLLKEPYAGVIVTISPKVSVKVVDEELRVSFDYNVVFMPTGMGPIDHSTFKPIIGDIVVDIMQKDYDAT